MDEGLISLGKLLINESSHQEIVFQLDLILRKLLIVSENIPKVWHPLGFLMINLGSISKQQTIRLHIWADDMRSTQEPAWLIHNHNWNFKSYILCGKITNQLYKITSNHNTPTNKIYQVVYADNKSNLIDTEQLVNYTLVSQMEFYKQDKYYLKSKEFHSTIVEKNTFTATIVLSNKIDIMPPEVIGELHGINSYSYERVTCNTDQFKKLINYLLSQIS